MSTSPPRKTFSSAVSNTPQLKVIETLCENIKSYSSFRAPPAGTSRNHALMDIIQITMTTLDSEVIRQHFPNVRNSFLTGTPLPPPSDPIIYDEDDDTDRTTFKILQEHWRVVRGNESNEQTANDLLVTAIATMAGDDYYHLITLPMGIKGPFGITARTLAGQTPHGAFTALRNMVGDTFSTNSIQDAYLSSFPANLNIAQCIGQHNRNVNQLTIYGRPPAQVDVPNQFIKNLTQHHPQFKNLIDMFNNLYRSDQDRTWPHTSSFFSSRGEDIEREITLTNTPSTAANTIEDSDSPNASAASSTRRPNNSTPRGRSTQPKMTIHAEYGPIDYSSIEPTLRQYGYRDRLPQAYGPPRSSAYRGSYRTPHQRDSRPNTDNAAKRPPGFNHNNPHRGNRNYQQRGQQPRGYPPRNSANAVSFDTTDDPHDDIENNDYYAYNVEDDYDPTDYAAEGDYDQDV